ncbi:lasso peptide biosynthesis PqqD family chaperone [Bacillus spongiae]|uniref:Lasso peptide biosynthesis PqqD family chaperone n=1 Tax=Bacillus spongiae TaxID=2683610 RepID=A0ABU8HED2_9BACI
MMKIEKLTTNDSIKQVEGSIVSDMNGEKVMLSISNGKYYNLGDVGGRIWELIDNPLPISTLVTKLMAEYEISKQECEEQVLSFLELLRQEQLVIVV